MKKKKNFWKYKYQDFPFLVFSTANVNLSQPTLLSSINVSLLGCATRGMGARSGRHGEMDLTPWIC